MLALRRTTSQTTVDGQTAVGSGGDSKVDTACKRGTSGGSHAGGSKGENERRWRSGAVPQALVFDVDIDSDSYCYRHYKRRLQRWVMITKEFLPPNEQAPLRALEQLRGEAELEFEEVCDASFNCKEGIALLLSDLEAAFGEKEIFRQGGTIRELESIPKAQGESVTAFTRGFRLLERKLADNTQHNGTPSALS